MKLLRTSSLSFKRNFQNVNLQFRALSVQATEAAEDWRKNLRAVDCDHLTGERPDWWYTGPNPANPKDMERVSNHSSHVSSLPQLVLKDVTEEGMRNYFENSWVMTEVLFAGLQGEEAFYRPPFHHLRHPKIFYYGHPATFYTNKLRVAGLVENGIDAYFEEIFEVGVDEMRWDDISTRAKDWPTVMEVHDYRKKCFQLVSDVISENFRGRTQTITWNDPLWSLPMCVEHEKIHLETSSVLMRELPLELLKKPKFFPGLHKSIESVEPTFKPKVGDDFVENALIPVNGQQVTLGKTTELEKMVFGWDNEYGCRIVDVPDFSCSKFKVTNGEYFEFVKEGGYRERRFWSEDGWGWRVFRNQKWPTFWVQRGPAGSHDYALRTIFSENPMPWNAPVSVNYHEASAFCAWKAEKLGLEKPLRLITEAEFMCIRDEELQHPLKSLEFDLSISKGACDEVNNNLASGSESSVTYKGPNSKGFHDVFGNTWEWSEDDFNPMDGFEVHPFYDDFSAPCFDGEHKMIFGGSFISSADNGGNVFSRYHFRPHFHQHAGFRYVLPSKAENVLKGQGIATFLGTSKAHLSCTNLATNMSEVVENEYETDRLLDQYVALHFGQEASVVDKTVKKHENRPDHALNFAQRSAALLSQVFERENGAETLEKAKALDVGCAVGGASFKLAEKFSQVVGIDYSSSFVNKASEISELHEGAKLKFKVPVSGDVLRSDIEVGIPPKEVRSKATFLTGDATKLEELNLGKFDAVLCANLVCRLPKPINFLKSLKETVKPNGIVLFLSPYSWLEEFTPKENWFLEEGKLSDEKLKETMQENGFEVVHEEDMPLIIREHERKYQYIVSHGLAFKKRA